MRARFVPVILLIAIATSQIALARAFDLTPWKGGGFGMFATLDHAAFRRVDIVVDAPGRSEALEIPPSLQVDVARAASFPAPWLLTKLAEGVAARERRNGRAVARVTLTVWRTAFDRVTLHAADQPLRTFVYNVP